MPVKPETQAERLLTKRVELENQITELRKKSGIAALETKLEKVKGDLTALMVEHEIEQVEGDGYHATLIRQSYGSMFIATPDDLRALDEIPKDRILTPLRTIIRRKFKNDPDTFRDVWNRVTKKVVVPEAIEEVVSEGILTVDEISESFIEKAKKPYARVFKD